VEFFSLKILPSLLVGLGGALGAITRFWAKEWLPQITSNQFPLSTLSVNLIGCFFAGLVYMWLHKSGQPWSETKSLFFFVGFLGALTTFSAFALDSLLLFNQGETLKFVINILANCLLCLACVFFGAWLGGRIAAN
jgi:CrcB protein